LREGCCHERDFLIGYALHPVLVAMLLRWILFVDVRMIVVWFVRVQVQFPVIAPVHVVGRGQGGGFFPVTFLVIKIYVSTPVVIHAGIRVIIIIISAPVSGRCIGLLNISRETACNQRQESPTHDQDHEPADYAFHDLLPPQCRSLACDRHGFLLP
jgi:hypothetical protein